MKIADFFQYKISRKPKTIRNRTSYRAARRNIAKFNYRHAKRND
jgi:hypothetical protein